jgi:AcrR family transcriptional regulator
MKPGTTVTDRVLPDAQARILDAAVALLEECGYQGFNTNAIAARAGLNVATLYRHFPDKFEVLRRLAQRLYAERADRLVVALDGLANAPDWRGFIRDLLEAVMHARRTQPGALAVRRALQAAPSLQVLAQHDLSRLIEAMAEALCRRRPALGRARAMLLSKTVFVSVGAMLDHAWDNPSCDEALVGQAAELAVRYLAPELD